ncbi:fructoselysine-6-phosphate deglycase [Breznakia sp. PF5-3]|uniref:SIS domain-containing protein n=1 Tax=unclassified Breznakia TaxID=2623764 RepID=UPI002407577A|nr:MULTISPECIES: SIS domain-containing protein [unclassified Breznakia]MDF9824760.1 fructoselysine-6-phosphate deglycase [Breznakia sp. PM6-1]MDF9835673.1 fructoselysine-6-phosphate deglycase [Breznakia sp. PF5-3]MDF9837722.1 fructoselysine-6-phosphate deglycase [Breznakia sp. PFB2-8]MDF9859683.1 fructoselysine-6-phosphate deglycase [Breznakia sp. PH5-24]
MNNFNEIKMLEDGAFIYNRRSEIEQIADAVCEKGFCNILFSSVGGSQAMMDPFQIFIDEMSDIQSFSELSSTLIFGENNQISKDTLVFMSSKSGDSKETVAAAEYLKKIGCTIVSVVGMPDSKMEKLSDYCFVYKDGRPQELVMYLLIGKILYNKGFFKDYMKFAKELEQLPAVLVAVRKQADAQALAYCEKYYAEPYNIWIASGSLWPVCYAYAMCVLEESQWIRTKSVSSPEFFHGTLELVEKDVCCTLLIGEGKTRSIDLRVKKFIETYSDKANVFDCADYAYPGISDEFRSLLSPVVMNAILQRISKNMEVVTGHSLDIRRYYRKVEY